METEAQVDRRAIHRRAGVQLLALAILVCVIVGMVVLPYSMYRDYQATRARVVALLEPEFETRPTRWDELEKLLANAPGKNSRQIDYSVIDVARVETVSWNAYFASWHMRFGIDRNDMVLSWDQEEDIGREPQVRLFTVTDDGKIQAKFDLSPETERRVTTDEWIKRFRALFSSKWPERQARILVLPAVGPDSIVIDDGILLGELAQCHLAEVSVPRLAVQPMIARTQIGEKPYYDFDYVVDDETAVSFRAATSSDLAVLPIIVEGNGKAQIRLRCFRSDEEPVETAATDFDPQRRDQLGQLVAKLAVTAAEVDLSPEAQQQLERPLISDADGYQRLAELYRSGDIVSKSQEASAFLKQYPECIPAWLWHVDRHLSYTTLPEMLANESVANHPVVCLTAAWELFDINRFEHAMQVMLDHAASEVDSPFFFWTLANHLKDFDDKELHDFVLGVWLENGRTYTHRTRQGTFHLSWAWKARGSGLANSVTPAGWSQFKERLNVSQRCYEGAIEVNPLDWFAHSQLINVAKGLGLSSAYVTHHRRKSAEAWPYRSEPWNNSLDYLRKKWHGDTDSLLAFARECVDSKQWNNTVPMLALTAIREAAGEPFENYFDDNILRRPDVWGIIQDLHAQACEQENLEHRVTTLAWFVHTGAYAQDWEAVAPALDEIAALEMSETDFQKKVAFPTRLAAIRDQLKAANGVGAEQHLAQARLALMRGDVTGAREIIENELEPAESTSHAYVARVAELAESLESAGRVDLAADEIFDTFCEVNRSGLVPLREANGWAVVDGRVTFTDPDPDAAPETEQRVFTRTIALPLGLTDVRITGRVPKTDAYRVLIHAHSFAERDTMQCYLDFFYNSVSLHRNRVAVRPRGSEDLNPIYVDIETSAEFVIEKRRQMDTITLAGHEWQMRVLEQVPSSIAIRFDCAEQGGQFALETLSIAAFR